MSSTKVASGSSDPNEVFVSASRVRVLRGQPSSDDRGPAGGTDELEQGDDCTETRRAVITSLLALAAISSPWVISQGVILRRRFTSQTPESHASEPPFTSGHGECHGA